MEATAAEAVAERTGRRRPAPGAPSPSAVRAPAPRSPRPSPAGRRPTAPFGAGFRRGLLLSGAVHLLLVGGVALRLLGGPAGSPPPGPLDTAFAPEWSLEEDPEMRTEEPEAVPDATPPTLLDEVVAEPDPREFPEPVAADSDAGPWVGDAGTIGIGRIGSRRAPRRIGRPGRAAAALPVPPAAPPQETAPPAPPPVLVAARPRPDLCAAPLYPRLEEERGVRGTVRLRIAVEADGSVSSVEVDAGSGSAALDAAAVEAVAGWTFRPATEDGHPVPSVVLQPVTFRPRR